MNKYLWIACIVAAPGIAHAEEQATPPPPPDAPPPPPVGGRGHVVFDILNADFDSSPNLLAAASAVGPLTFSTYHSTSQSSKSLGVVPSADVFITDRVSLGGRLGVTWASTRSGGVTDHAWTATALPRLGYSLPISSTFAFWPRLGVGVISSAATPNVSDADFFVTVELNPSFVARLTSHVVLELGPLFDAYVGVGANNDASWVSFGTHAAMRVDF